MWQNTEKEQNKHKTKLKASICCSTTPAHILSTVFIDSYQVN